MIKFFSNVRNRLISESKTGKYLKYAIGEIFLVVLGILIALQVNNWNISRINSKQEVIILNDLKQEYIGKLGELNQKIYLRNIMINSSSQLLQMIQDGKFNISRDSLDQLVGSTFLSPTFDASNSVTEELLNSGKLYIIQNRELRKHITDWNSQLEKLDEEETNLVNSIVNNYIPYIIKRYPYNTLATFFSNNNDEVWGQIIKNSGAESYRMQASKKNVDLEALLNDYEFESFMAIINLSSAAGNLQSEDLKKFIENVLNLIDKELQKK